MFGVAMRLIAGLSLGVVMLWTGGLIWFAATLPQNVADSRSRTDGIVVLTGGSARLAAGIDLLSKGRAKKLLISGVHQETSKSTLGSLSKTSPKLFECCIELGRSAADTVGNAHETAAWAKREKIKSLRLVTSTYHMPRSLVEFRQALPDVRLIAHPVFSETVKLEGWWRWPGTASLLSGEFNKYIFSLVRARLGKEPPA